MENVSSSVALTRKHGYLHVKLSDKACNLIVFVVERQEILGELRLVPDNKASSILRAERNVKKYVNICKDSFLVE
jgi:hypothetical protein